MADYTPTFTITNTMLDCVASISEKIGKMSALKNLEAKPHLRKNNRIRSIYSSLRIEAFVEYRSGKRCYQWTTCIGRTKRNSRSKKCIRM